MTVNQSETTEPTTDSLRPMTELQRQQVRSFVTSIDEESQTYWDMVEVGDVLERTLTVSPELVILYADGVEDYTPWYEGWKMNTWSIPGSSPFGAAIVPPMMMSHFILSVMFDHTKPFAAGSIHTSHESTIHGPIPVGATVRIRSEAVDKFHKRGRRYLGHRVTVTDADSDELYLTETREILSR